LLGDKVQITGTVIGVDNQQDVSNFVDLDPRSAGIYVETPTADQDLVGGRRLDVDARRSRIEIDEIRHVLLVVDPDHSCR